MAFHWDAFQALNASRQSGLNGALPISLAEIMAFCAIAGIIDPSERMALLHAVQAMDGAFLKWANGDRDKDD